ncbi:MAG: UDP-N-acetylmuramoyl-L-alanine--D-glutamate ligase [Desulfobacteraceae bacterium IS3]|nr:MAG: UDP-N-acetylmuramoyl-L-alanine--D-glutamate ligase [Desulfobacteraceae bacterium IS3]
MITMLAGQHIFVVGLGKSGIATARFLKNKGAMVTVSDSGSEAQLADAAALMRNIGANVRFGAHHLESFEKADMIVLSPGVPHTIDPIIRAKARGIPVIGETELAYRFVSEPIVAVTGTNGKTTVTTLIGEMLTQSGFKVFVGGNIGHPLIAYADSEEKADRIVLEISSFQLDTIERFKADAAVLLNITEDHLDRYPDFRAYGYSKARIFENQTRNDAAILNAGDSFICELSKSIRSKKVFYNPLSENASDMLEKIDFSCVKLPGKHNMENVSAACLAARAVGGTPEAIQRVLSAFKGLPHRIEFVAEINGVKYFDDSKGTNIDAVIRALECFQQPVILILGGRGKGSDFGLLSDSVRSRVKAIVAIGETKEEIVAALDKDCRQGAKPVLTMAEAVSQARTMAEPGDVVLLSPACASFDMFTSYAHRGQVFCQAVKQSV